MHRYPIRLASVGKPRKILDLIYMTTNRSKWLSSLQKKNNSN